MCARATMVSKRGALSLENYQLWMEKESASLNGRVPRLLLHACCGPCSSAVLERLAPHFFITIDSYNPNIYPEAEHDRRAAEAERFVAETPREHPVTFRLSPFAPQEFYDAVKGLENIPEGGERCFACYELRLRHTAALAAAEGFDYFASTLSISPHKNAAKLNEIGFALEREYGVKYLASDFKKKNGYKRSLELSQEYGLYRQDYCGCIFSKRERGV